MARRASGIDSLVSKTIDSVVNGVSQQPATIRLASQCEVQDNMISSAVKGVSRRPPTEHIDTLTADATPAEGYFMHLRNRDADLQHVVLIEDGDIRVFRIRDGVEATVTDTSGTYLDIAGTDASQAYAMVSVADYSFVVNKETVVAMSGVTTAARVHQFLIYWVESASNQNFDFKQTIGAVAHSVTDFGNAGSGGSDPQDMIQYGLTDAWNATDFPRWTFTNPVPNVILAEQTTDTGNPDDIGVPSYGFSDEVYEFIGPTTQKFSNLPRRAPDGFLTEITGTDGNEENNYWVAYDEAAAAWAETVGPTLDNDVDQDTLPHVLVQTVIGVGAGADTFTFGPQTWDARLKGDIDSAPEPSFVGKKITDVFFHKNRLGFTADENTILSEAGEFFNFWPTTVTALIDSDPVDVSGTNNRVGLIDYAVPFDGRLFTFSGHGAIQNALSGGDGGLTNLNAEVTEASAFASAKRVRPQASGSSVFFAVDHEVYTEIKEYTIEDGVADAADITSHVPTYLPANFKQIAISDKRQLLVGLSADETDKLYIYSWHYNSQRQKIQSSWSRWLFDAAYDIIGIGWVGDKLYLVVERDDGVHLEVINPATLVEGALAHRVRLDSLEELTGVFTVADGLTRWTTTYAADDGDFRAVLSATAHSETGRALDLTLEASSGKLYAEGDFSAGAAHIGRKYTFTYEFTKPTIQQEGGNTAKGAEPVTQGRLQIRKMKLLVAESGGFKVTVQSDEVNPLEIIAEQDTYTYDFPEKIVDLGDIGPANPRPVAEFLFDVGMESKYARISVIGDSHLDFTLIGAEWEGWLSQRSARV